MAEILHQLIGSSSRLYTSQVVQDFSHQQYHLQVKPGKSLLRVNIFKEFPADLQKGPRVCVAILVGG